MPSTGFCGENDEEHGLALVLQETPAIQEMTTKQAQTPQADEFMAMAERLMQQGNTAEAEVLLRRAIEALPELDPAYHALGLMAFGAGDLESAIDLVGKAASLCPSNALYQRNRGELCRRLGRLDEAVMDGQRASALAPLDVDAHFNLGLALSDRGDWPEAIASYHRALALRPDHGLTWNNLGVAQERGGQRTEAMQSYTRATQLNPGHVEAQFNLGLMYKQAGRLGEAGHCFRLVQELAPGFAEQKGLAAESHVAPILPPQVSMRDTCSPRGRGIFAERSYMTGELVETAPVILLHIDYQALPDEIKSYVFNWGKLCGLGSAQALALGYGGLYNHDSPANLRYEADPANLAMRFIATRTISADEELTINYNSPFGTDDENNAGWFARMNIKPIVSSSPQG